MGNTLVFVVCRLPLLSRGELTPSKHACANRRPPGKTPTYNLKPDGKNLYQI